MLPCWILWSRSVVHHPWTYTHQLAKSILSAESARNLGQATATITTCETKFSNDTVRAPARVPFLSYTGWALQDHAGAQVSYTHCLSTLLLIVAICGRASYNNYKLVESHGARRLCFFLGRLHQKTCPCLHKTVCQRLCTRPWPQPSNSVAMLLKKWAQTNIKTRSTHGAK